MINNHAEVPCASEYLSINIFHGLSATRWASANQYFHLSYAEFASTVLMSNMVVTNPSSLRRPLESITDTIPVKGAAAAAAVSAGASKSVNWVTLGRTTPVKNQARA